MGIIANAQRGLLSRRIIVWIAAYALLLQSVVAPLIASPLNSRSLDGNPLFELCLFNKSGSSPVSGGIPTDPRDHDIHCKLCVHGAPAFHLAPRITTAFAEQAVSVSIRWAVIDNPVPDDTRFIRKHARGPPLLT